jgi:uncharacterized membrane protein
MLETKEAKFATPIVEPIFYMLTGISLLCTLLIGVRADQVGSGYYRFLLWNLFLAWLPLIVSMTALAWIRVTKGAPLAVGVAALAFGWLLLYPNAPYLTTDLIHLILYSPSYEDYTNDGLLVWFDLVLLFLFSWCGLLLGFMSTRHFHSIIAHYLGGFAGWAFVLIVSFLGGFGVYLGRVIRLNSWDVVFNPFRLIEGVIDGINKNALIFTILFGTFILIVYLSFYVLGKNKATDLQ